jgi:DnaJ domain
VTDEPFALLGLAPNATADEVRAAFRQRIVQHHPDVAGGEGASATRTLVGAYRQALAECELRSAPLAASSTVLASDVAAVVDVAVKVPTSTTAWLVDRDTIALACDHQEAFARVLDVAHRLGAITYLDRQGDLLEVLLRTKLGDTVSLVMSFQGRSHWVEVFLTTEVLDRAKHELPTIDQLTELVLHHLRVNW